MKADLLIQHGQNMQYPIVAEGIEWQTERKGSPGKLTFTVIMDSALNFAEGDSVRFSVDGTDVFYGFVFTKKRNKERTIDVTAYDQLRYLKNKDTYVYKDKTATEVIQMIAEDFKLNVGTLDDTGYKIGTRTEDDSALFDIIQNALDETLTSKQQMYVLYDDVGKLTLKNIENMKTNLLLNADTLGNFDYKSTIDSSTYDQVKVVYEDSDAGKREIYVAKDSNHINTWGVLQLTDSVEVQTNAQAKADGLLALYNTKTRTLTASDVLGDVRIRAGSSVAVMLNLGDISVKNYMVVESAKHTFNADEHLMELKLRGGSFIV
jgi:hypothetical protein